MVSLVLSMAGRYYPGMPAKMMGKMTLSYGVAQIIGPAVTGQIGAQLGQLQRRPCTWPPPSWRWAPGC